MGFFTSCFALVLMVGCLELLAVSKGRIFNALKYIHKSRLVGQVQFLYKRRFPWFLEGWKSTSPAPLSLHRELPMPVSCNDPERLGREAFQTNGAGILALLLSLYVKG